MKNNIVDKIKGIFYRTKYKNGYKVTRILFFKQYKKLKNCAPNPKGPSNLVQNGRLHEKINLYYPNLPHIGKNSYSAKDLMVCSDKTSIGKFVSIGQHVVIGHGIHPLNYLSTSPFFYFNNLGWKNKDQVEHPEFWDCSPVKIGNDVWIGDSVFIKNGITIGDGAIIGAKSIVTKDVPPYAIIAGNPATIIKYRFEEKIIKKLLELQWWNLDDKIIKQIPYDDIYKAIEFLEKTREI